MKIARRFAVLCLSLGAASLFAGTTTELPVDNSVETPVETGPPFPFEFDAEYAYIGDSTVERGPRVIRDFDESYSLLRFVYTPRMSFGILRLGVAYERFGFGIPDNVQLEDALQSITAVVGLDTQFSDSILVRLEAQPGFYGANDELDGKDFNVPFLLGGTYIYNPNLQFVLGVSVDFEREYPVIPGGGIRWRIGEQWVLNLVAPTPRLEFAATESITLYAGGNIKGSTFRTGETFGSRIGEPRLDNAVISYMEVRVGGGIELKVSPGVKLSIEGGYVPYRDFDYHRADINYLHEEGAAYGAIGFHAAF